MTCFCGMDGVATCQGCGRRVCYRHAIPERSFTGYRRPDDELFASGGLGDAADRVAQVGYAAKAGIHCPDCRNNAGRSALKACPRMWPDDPIERLAYEYENYGAARALPAGTWGPSLASALKARNRPSGTYRFSEQGWLSNHPEFDGRPVWRFIKPGQYDQQVSAYAPSRTPSPVTVLILDGEGRTPDAQYRLNRGFLNLGKPRQELVKVTWRSGFERSGVPDPNNNTEIVIAQALVGRPQTVVPFIGSTYPAPEDERWHGLEPSAVYAWLRDHSLAQQEGRQ